MKCPCGTNETFETCCGPFLAGKSRPETAEKLMRSRYTAYTKADIDYLKKTMIPEERKEFDAEATRQWAEGSKWKGLKIVATEKGGPNDKGGMVEFIATYEKDGKGIDHHEVSHFRKTKDGDWLFVAGEGHEHAEGEGHHHEEAKGVTIKRESPKIGRNDPCHCGSGKKFKKCCEAAA
jgi:SEC-C motif-containing protein